jgi:hypothetical protein
MAELREFAVTLLDWETRYILQSISNELQRLKTIAESSEDPDEAADAGNDYVELSGLYESLSKTAISTFGSQITDYSNQEI